MKIGFHLEIVGNTYLKSETIFKFRKWNWIKLLGIFVSNKESFSESCVFFLLQQSLLWKIYLQLISQSGTNINGHNILDYLRLQDFDILHAEFFRELIIQSRWKQCCHYVFVIVSTVNYFSWLIGSSKGMENPYWSCFCKIFSKEIWTHDTKC